MAGGKEPQDFEIGGEIDLTHVASGIALATTQQRAAGRQDTGGKSPDDERVQCYIIILL
jgi:hypothetical protein